MAFGSLIGGWWRSGEQCRYEDDEEETELKREILSVHFFPQFQMFVLASWKIVFSGSGQSGFLY